MRLGKVSSMIEISLNNLKTGLEIPVFQPGGAYNMDIVKLDTQRKKEALDVIVAAFFDYPEFHYYFPDPVQRKRVMAWYLGRVLDTAVRYGEVFTTWDRSGVIFILPPGHTRISQWEYIRCGFLPAALVLGMRDFIRSQKAEDYLGTLHESTMAGRPHYYLWGLVVDPARKRQGIGTALLSSLLARADAEKMPIYLETHDEKNVAYYQRFGFQLAKTGCIPQSDVRVWAMVREVL
jgi:ribosomal protein S18 acetylase RimI-like enzyme